MMTKDKYNSIDLFKLIMAFSVIAIHTNPLVKCSNTVGLAIYDSFVRIAVPFFFLSSGFLLANGLNYDDRECDLRKLKKYLFKIIKMYVVWMFIYTPISVMNSINLNISFKRAFLYYLRGVFFTGEQYNSWHLWYLLSTIYTLIILMVLVRVKLNSKYLIIMSIAFIILSLSLDCFVVMQIESNSILKYTQKIIINTVMNGRICLGMVYIPIGMILKRIKIQTWMYALLFSVGFILDCAISNPICSELLLIVSSICFFGIVINISLRNKNIYPLFREISTITYLIHMYVWSVYYWIVYGKKNQGIDSFLVTSIMSVAIAVIYIMIKKLIYKKIKRD